METSLQGSGTGASTGRPVVALPGAAPGAMPTLKPTEHDALDRLLTLLRDPACRGRLRAEAVPQPALDWLVSTAMDLLESGVLPLGASHLHARYLIGISAAVFDHLDAWGHAERGLREPIDAIGRIWLRAIEDLEEVWLRVERSDPLPRPR